MRLAIVLKAIMKYFVGGVGNYSFSRTYWNLGKVAQEKGDIKQAKSSTKYGFVYNTNLTVSPAALNGTRCVRDIRVD